MADNPYLSLPPIQGEENPYMDAPSAALIRRLKRMGGEIPNLRLDRTPDHDNQPIRTFYKPRQTPAPNSGSLMAQAVAERVGDERLPQSPAEERSRPRGLPMEGRDAYGQRTLGDIVLPDDVEAMDYGRSALAGAADLGSGAGWVIDQLGAAPWKPVLLADDIGQTLQELGQQGSEYWMRQMSEGAQRALQRQFIEDDGSIGDFNLQTIGLTGAQSTVPTMLGMGTGGLFAKGLGWLGMGPGVSGAIGYGTGETAVSAPMAASETAREVLGIPIEELQSREAYQAIRNQFPEGDEGDEAARAALADAAGRKALALTGGTTFAMSAPAGAVLGRLFRGAPSPGTRSGNAVMGAGTEALQEFGQSGAEQIGQNIALSDVTDRAPLAGAANAAVGGALTGGLMGAGFGLASPVTPAQRDAAQAGVDPSIVEWFVNEVNELWPRAAQAGVDPSIVEGAPPAVRAGMEDAAQNLEMSRANDLDMAVQQRAAEIFGQQEAPNAQEVRGDARQVPQEGPVEAGRPEEGGQDLQRQAQAGAEAGGAQEVIPRPGAQPVAQTGDPLMDYRPEDLMIARPIQDQADTLEQDIDRAEDATSSVTSEQLPKVRRREGGYRQWDDARLKRKSFRQGLQAMSRSLRRGGGSMGRYDTYEGDRPREGNEIIGVPSENPRWFQGINANEGIGVEGVRKAVDKALRGRPLGEREARVIETMLDIQSFERMGGNTETGEDQYRVSEMLEQLRDQRRADRGELTDAEIDTRAEELAERGETMLGRRYAEEVYEADLARADRAMYDLAQDAAAVDEIAVNRILESNRDETETIRALWEVTQRGQDGQGNQGVPREQGQGAPQSQAQQGQEAPAPRRPEGQVAQADAFEAPTESQQGAEDQRRAVQGRMQGQRAVPMEQGEGELFAGPRPEQPDVFGEDASQPHEPPTDADGSALADLDGNPVPTNEDGTITLYHRTTPENAQRIRETGRFVSRENTQEAFFSTSPEGQAEGYGDEVIAVQVSPSEVRLDDAFQDGEVHVAAPVKRLTRNARIVPAEPRTGQGPAAGATRADQPATETDETAPDRETGRRRDRRIETEKRQIIQSLPPEQQEVMLRSDVVPALRSKRAFEIHRQNNPDERVLFFDFDDFKAVNDKLGELETDEAVLEPAGEIIQAAAEDAEVNAYHRSGDEFMATAATDEQLTQFAEALRERLKGARLEATLPDGTTDTIEGIEFSYGTGKNEQAAREASKRQKAERRRAGQRTGARDQGVDEQAPGGDEVSVGAQREGRVDEAPQEPTETPPDGGVSRSGPRYSFAGSRARTADQNELANAKQRVNAGDSPDTVRRETGWFKGDDGRWRFEISDHDAKLHIAEGNEPRTGVISDFLEHDRLYAAYPEIANIDVQIRVSGEVTRPGGQLQEATIDGVQADPMITVRAKTPGQALNILLHEVQHGIQRVEGFARGGSPEQFRPGRRTTRRQMSQIQSEAERLYNEHRRLANRRKPDGSQLFPPWNDADAEARREFFDRASQSLYRRLAGEVEARNVQGRQEMTPEQRRETSPDDTRDTPAEDVVVVYDGEVMENAPPPANAAAPEAARSTPESFRATFTPRAQRALFDSGLVEVTQSPTEWPGSHPQNAAGAWINGKVYIATNNVRPGRERGLILHEVGVHHGLQDMLGDQYDTLIGRLQRQVRLGGRENATTAQREAYQAHQRALRDDTISGDDTALWEETVAYMAESGANTPLMQRIAAAIRRFLRRMGLVRDYTNADVADLARGSVERVMAGRLDDGARGPVYAQARYQRSDQPVDQTQTEAFSAWFGDSKVVDPRGRPKIVYHGSPDARGIFGDSPGFQAPGERLTGRRSEDEAYFFTDSRAVARTYADDSRAFDYQNAQNAILQTYLSLQNPMEIDAGGKSWGERGGPASQAEQIAEAKRLGHDGMIIRNTLDTYNVDGDQRATIYVAFEPTQIKSAESGPVRDLFDGSEVPGSGPNIGTFDPNNPDIRYSRAEDADSMSDPARRPEQREITGGTFDEWTMPAREAREQLRDEANDRLTKRLTDSTARRFRKGRIIFQDKLLPLKEAVEAARQYGTVQELTETYKRAENAIGKTGDRMDRLEERHVMPLVDKMREYGIGQNELGDYLYARHAKERNKQIAEINDAHTDTEMNPGSGMADSEADRILGEYKGAKKRQMEELAKMVDGVTRQTRETLVDSGLIAEEVAEAWNKTYDHYVPLKGIDGETESFESIGRGFDMRGQEVKRALGRRTPAKGILAQVIADAQRAIIRSEKNEVGKSLMLLALENPNSNLWEVNPIEAKRVVDDATGKVVYRYDRKWHGDDIFITKVKGKAYAIQLEPQLAKAMKNLGAENMNIVLRGTARLNRWLSYANTALNPEFVITNFFRDFEQALVQLHGERGSEIAKAVAKDVSSLGPMLGSFHELSGQGSFMSRATEVVGRERAKEWSDWFAKYRESGGKISYFRQESIPEQVSRIQRLMKKAENTPGAAGRRAVKAVVDLVENINGAVENAVRVATYKNMVEQGYNQTDAAHAARDLTVNFNRRGEYGVMMNSLYLFYNASIQGTYRAFAAMKHKRVRRIIGSAMAGQAILTIFNYMMAGEDDDGENRYEKIPDYEKSRNIIIMTPSGEPVKIPMPYLYNAFMSIPENIVGTAFGREPGKATSNVVHSFLESVNPLHDRSWVNQLAPTVADPFVDIWQNQNFFGEKIMPENPYEDYDRPDSDKYWASVNPIALKSAKLLNEWTGGSDTTRGLVDVSPESLEYMWDHFTGAAGAFVQRSVSFAANPREAFEENKVPFLRKVYGANTRFYANDQYDAAQKRIEAVQEALDRFDAGAYENMGEMIRARREYRDENEKIVDLIGPYERTEKRLRNLYKRRGRIMGNKRLSNEVRESRLEDVEQKITEARARFLERYNEAFFFTGRG